MGTKSNPGRFFEDFRVGETIRHVGARTVTEGDQAVYMALTGDRHPVYCAAGFARSLGYDRELVNDLLVFNIIFGKTVPDISLNAVANLGYAEVRFDGPVYPGETLRAVTDIIGKKDNSSGKNGNVYVQTRGYNQNDDCVLSFCRWVMVHKRNHAAPMGEQVVPRLQESVPAELLTVDGECYLDGIEAAPGAGPHFYEDYEVGEHIVNDAGMTLENAEHASATRLYQNTAKVHFDARAMEQTPHGKRLIYGGHVISVARALCYTGMENALRILAWNGGTHANPVFAGDTVYAGVEVLDKTELTDNSRAGALRLRLAGYKNQAPREGDTNLKRLDETKGREVYLPHVILDLDYWVLMPRRNG